MTSPSAPPEPTPKSDFHPAPHPAAIPAQYDTPRPTVPLAGPSAVHQWAGPPNPPYLDQSHSAGMLPAAAAAPPNPSMEPHSALVPDADMLQAAQLLLPGDYRATGAFSRCIAKAICRPLQAQSTMLRSWQQLLVCTNRTVMLSLLMPRI